MLSESCYYAGQMSEKLTKKYRVFLAGAGLRDENDTEYTLLLTDDETGEIMACGSLRDNVLKQIAVSPKADGTGLCARVVTALTEYAVSRGGTHLFVYTKPGNRRMFESLGYSLIVCTESILMMENRRGGLDAFLASLPRATGKTGALVMNCNPFTLGHRHLVEYAATHCDYVYLFVLSEDASLFPAEVRYELVRKGTEDLGNVHVVKSRDYLISRATFPTYFIKESAAGERARCELDILLFAKRIAPALGITVRFAGEEPFDAVTAEYNAQMKKLLPEYGIAFAEIPRYRNISASHVRRLLTEGRTEEARELLPDTTYDYCRGKFGTGAPIQG